MLDLIIPVSLTLVILQGHKQHILVGHIVNHVYVTLGYHSYTIVAMHVEVQLFAFSNDFSHFALLSCLATHVCIVMQILLDSCTKY
jgi:hypothetical protein